MSKITKYPIPLKYTSISSNSYFWYSFQIQKISAVVETRPSQMKPFKISSFMSMKKEKY